MPSRFEPCGLNQIYSLRYGTVPLVRATGGLADTIVGYDPLMPNPAANGFVFQEYSSLALSECLRQACDAYRRPEVWRQLVAAGMGQDWSWARSAKQYVELYQKTDGATEAGCSRSENCRRLASRADLSHLAIVSSSRGEGSPCTKSR